MIKAFAREINEKCYVIIVLSTLDNSESTYPGSYKTKSGCERAIKRLGLELID